MSAPAPDSIPLWGGNDPTPVLLTPVRLETRYLPTTDPTAPPLLAIRVIPDDIARYTFEPDLTPDEYAAGARYWSAVGAGADPASAWIQVQHQLGNARGAWAVEATRPDTTRTDPGTRTTVHPASSLILPAYFNFRGWRDNTAIFDQNGNNLPHGLCLGPDWSQLGPTDSGDPADQHPWTASSKWMVDLTEAIRVGMAITVPLTGTNLAFDSITVVGYSTAPAADATDRLARTLQGHLYTGGLGFPPPGSPTNNTPATRSQWSSTPTLRTPNQVSAAIAAAAPGQPGVSLADALGLAADARPGIPGRRDLLAASAATAPGDDALAQRAHQVIATYYRLLTSGGGLLNGAPPPARDALAAHFVSHVRAAGPLPVLRVGRQPYGVLPVTATGVGLWHASAPPDVADPVLRALYAAQIQLNKQLDISPRLTGDPHQDEDPVLMGLFQRQPTAVQLRAANGNHTTATLRTPNDIPCVSAPFDLTPSTTPDPSHPPAWPLAAMNAIGFSSADDPRLEAFCVNTNDISGVCHNNGLYWAIQAYAALHWQGALLGAHNSPTPWATYAQAVADALNPLRALEADAANDWASVDSHLAAAVAALGPRADAWATSIATARLQSLRTTITGIHLGMYGWLVDVEPMSRQARADENGWTLTPSPQHAITACVLFAGAEAHNSTAYDIDLTSARVRQAQTLLAGIREGSTLEELLGYQLERALHDHHLDVAIAALRQNYPLPLVAATTLPDASRTARLVVNGDAVRRDPTNASRIIESQLTTNDPPTQAAVATILADLDRTVDAAGDVLLAESVHQLVGGSPLRAGLTVDTLGKAVPPPQRLDVISTPTAAVTVTHTIAIAVNIAEPASWPASARSALDPTAEAIAAWALGSPDEWRIDVTDTSNAVTSLTPAALGISAIDLVTELTAPEDGCALAARARAHLAAAADTTVTVHRTDGHGGTAAAAVLTGAIRGVLARARPVIDPATLLDPATEPGPSSGLDELANRIAIWWAQIQAALPTPSAPETPPEAAPILARLSQLGLQGARFDSPASTLAQLTNQWGGVTTIITAPPTAATAAQASAWLTTVTGTLRSATGDWFTAAPGSQTATGATTLGDTPTSGAGDDDIDSWIASHAPMCAGVSALDDLLKASGACGSATGPQWMVRQRLNTDTAGLWRNPSTPGAWIGSSDPGGRSANSLTALHIGDPTPQPQRWISIDHWGEATPPTSADDPQHDAGLSLRVDSPDSRSPQALLLAVPPNPTGWNFTDLQAVVDQTLWWTRVRPLDTDDLPELGLY